MRSSQAGRDERATALLSALLAAGGGRRAGDSDGDGLQRRAIGNWMLEFHSVLGNTAMASLSTSTLGGLSLFSRCRCRCRCRGRRLELCRCGTTFQGRPPIYQETLRSPALGRRLNVCCQAQKAPGVPKGLLGGGRLVRVAPAPWRTLNQG
ncbi:hypothetical protein P171DRAFT_104825 [Karstenula rhodostoma CBS 690.94]|uniref:Uncharacterized protein n=1 Tax=Karstenula rhodostoma CBS 690.94 TaxID=1392251 RepID=A0A9P4PAU5_9PLEO|nr:hypothetical protein P171DRAFT_104825 [Karstenula rhodostoma CBS 690.94]